MFNCLQAGTGGYHLQKEGSAAAGGGIVKEEVLGKGSAAGIKTYGATSLSTSSQTKLSGSSPVHKPVACRVTRHSPTGSPRIPANTQHSPATRREEGSVSPSPRPGGSFSRVGRREASRSPVLSHPGRGTPHSPGTAQHSSRFETYLSQKPPLPVFSGISAADSESIYDIPWQSHPPRAAPSSTPGTATLNKSQSLKALNGEVRDNFSI